MTSQCSVLAQSSGFRPKTCDPALRPGKRRADAPQIAGARLIHPSLRRRLHDASAAKAKDDALSRAQAKRLATTRLAHSPTVDSVSIREARALRPASCNRQDQERIDAISGHGAKAGVAT